MRDKRLIPAVRTLLDGLEGLGCQVDPCTAWDFRPTRDGKAPGGDSWTNYIRAGRNDGKDITETTLEGARVFATRTGKKLHGHHIVMKGKRFEENAKARRILCKHGIDPYIGRENLAYSPNWCHSKKYAEKVLELLENETDTRQGVIQALKEAARLHRRCTGLDRSGEADETDKLPGETE